MRHTRMLPGFLGAALALIVGAPRRRVGRPAEDPT